MLLQLLEKINQFLLSMKALSPPMLQAARQLLTNQQGGILAQMKVSENQTSELKTLGCIVVHVISVLFSNSKLQVLLPFVKMLENPVALSVSIIISKNRLMIAIWCTKDCYLPTMVEGISFQELQNAMATAKHGDPNGRFISKLQQ